MHIALYDICWLFVYMKYSGFSKTFVYVVLMNFPSYSLANIKFQSHANTN